MPKATCKTSYKKGEKVTEVIIERRQTRSSTSAIKVKVEVPVEEIPDEINPELLQSVKTEIKVEDRELELPEDRCEKYTFPPHLLGRNLNDPSSDVSPGHRPLQKPRLGVRVPYRNLTSQIISNEELAEEVLNRISKKKYPWHNDPKTVTEGKVYAQAMKLRLASKLPKFVGTKVQFKTDSMGILRHVGEMDPEVEKTLALKQLKEIPKRPRIRDRVKEDVDYKKVSLDRTLTSQEIALRQLEELESCKPRPNRATR